MTYALNVSVVLMIARTLICGSNDVLTFDVYLIEHHDEDIGRVNLVKGDVP